MRKAIVMIVIVLCVAVIAGCSTLNTAGLFGKSGIASQQLKDDWAVVKAQLLSDSVSFACANEAAFTAKANGLGIKPGSGKAWSDVFAAFCPVPVTK